MMCTSSISYIIDRDNKKPERHFKSPGESSFLDTQPQQPHPRLKVKKTF